MTSKVYARIRLRRGLYADLPQLRGSELGHAIDERRLFIGNGSTAEGAPTVGNTELLTQYSDNMNVIKHTYKSNTGIVAQTGPDSSHPVERSLQEVFDDYVSVKDFGAKGDGITDDSAAFNRALSEIYSPSYPVGYVVERIRRLLYIPAGKYIINSALIIPAYAKLVGDGTKSSVIVLKTGTAAQYMFETADSKGQTGSAIGTNSASLPSNIHIENVSFISEDYKKIGKLNRCSTIKFVNVLFDAAWVTGSAANSLFEFNKLGSVITMTDIVFDGCYFNNFYQLFDLTNCSALDNVFVIRSKLVNGHTGIIASNSATIWKISENTFTNIENSGVTAQTGTSAIQCLNNTFKNVGATDVVYPVTIQTNAQNCSSIGDVFISCASGKFVDNQSSSSVVNNSQGFGTFQNTTFIPSRDPQVISNGVTDASITTISIPVAPAKSVFIDYTLLRGTSTRMGRLGVISDGTTNLTVFDMSNSTADLGVSFSAVASSGNILLRYTATNTGISGTLYLSGSYWLHT